MTRDKTKAYKSRLITADALMHPPPDIDDDNDDWDDDPLDSVFGSEADELADTREVRAWEVYLCLIESMSAASCLPSLGRPRTPAKVPVLDVRALARASFEAADAFAEVAEPQHAEHVRYTKRESERR